MTYKLECFIEKIKAPIICVFDGKEVEYADGETLAEQEFDRYWLVDRIELRDRNVVLVMRENTRTNNVDWIGEEGVDRSFF